MTDKKENSMEITTRLVQIGNSSTGPVKIISIPITAKPSSVVDFRHLTVKKATPSYKMESKSTMQDLVSKTTNKPMLSKGMVTNAKAAFPSKSLTVTPVKNTSYRASETQVNYANSENRDRRKKMVSRAETYTNELAYSVPKEMGRPRKPPRKSFYAYVTDSESENETRVAKKKKVVVDEREVLSARRSKRESLSQKLVEWGLLPGKHEGSNAALSNDSEDEMDPHIPVTLVKKSHSASKSNSSHQEFMMETQSEKTAEDERKELTFSRRLKKVQFEEKEAEEAKDDEEYLEGDEAAQKDEMTLDEKIEKPEMVNKSLMCKPIMLTKATVCNPLRIYKSVQTDVEENKKKKLKLVAVPVPIIVPLPTLKCPLPVEFPVPMPVPLPVPCMLPLTRKSVADIMKKLQDIQDAMSDPLESNLLEMAEALANSKTPEDILKEEENAKIVRTICFRPKKVVAPRQRYVGGAMGGELMESEVKVGSEIPEYESTQKMRYSQMPESSRTVDLYANIPRKPNDTQLKLKYSYAVRAWKNWATTKNSELNNQTQAGKVSKIRFYNEELLQCSFDEIRAGLAAFVAELKKPDGSKYLPDSVYYLCLGLQYYLYENRRSDNIFIDVAFSKFSDNLNDLLSTFQIKINPQNMLICRVTEDQLWEARVLGAYNPMSLISTLIYLNTKNFGLHTAESHLMLSFVDIQRVSEVVEGRKINKLVFQRTDAKSKLEITCEMHECPDDPMRCPVKLYDFYLCKCPDLVRRSTRVFYLTPEMTCRPENETWFTIMAMSRNTINKIINRNRVVREIQISRLQMMQYS